MRPDRRSTEAGLAKLVGLPLWGARRASSMQVLHFGARHDVVINHGTRRGELATVGELALHIQCGWRITGPDAILVGARDLFVPAGPAPEREPEGWDWERPGASRRDERLGAWLQARTYQVVAVEADRFGGCRLTFEHGHALEIFPDASSDTEHWRLFRPGNEEAHLVVEGDQSS